MTNSNRTKQRRAAQVQPDLLGILSRIERKVNATHALLTSGNKEYLTTVEACQYLGCHRSMIINLCKSGKLTKLKKDNGRTYYRQDELKAYIERKDTPETEETTEGAVATDEAA